MESASMSNTPDAWHYTYFRVPDSNEYVVKELLNLLVEQCWSVDCQLS